MKNTVLDLSPDSAKCPKSLLSFHWLPHQPNIRILLLVLVVQSVLVAHLILAHPGE